MSRWRPSYEQDWKENIQKFLAENEEIPIQDPREFVKFATNKLITDLQTNDKRLEEAREQLDELREQLEK